MPVNCSECRGDTIWDDEAASAICTTCGTLTDPSQSILTSQDYRSEFFHSNPLWDPAAPTTLKVSRRNGGQWDLSGQEAEARGRKNSASRSNIPPSSLLTALSQYAIAEFINSLAVSMNAAGLSPRALTLFNQAKTAGQFRWGRKTRLIAGACLSIALREANRPNSLHDIAFLLKASPTSLTRTYISITSLLNFTSTVIDPSVHISTLQSHLASVLRDNQKDSGLPDSLVKFLQPICLRSVATTANSLCSLIARLCPDDDLKRLPPAPTACAIFMLSLEAECRDTISPLGSLAQCLGARCHVGKGVVMTRYKAIQDEVASWIEKVPWLDKYEGKSRRAKVSRRLVVARGLKDVINFQDEIWRDAVPPNPVLDEDDEDEKSDSATNSPASSIQDTRPHPRKRQKTHHSLLDATHFLLDPLSGSIPPSSHTPTRQHSCTLPSTAASTLPSSSSSNYPLPVTSYILTAPLSNLITKHAPTRLQRLTVDRGGSGETEIIDDELFAEGELEGFLRNEGEVEILRQALGWDQDKPEPVVEEIRVPRKSRLGIAGNDAVKKKSKLNLEALSRFLDGSDEEKESDFEFGLYGFDRADGHSDDDVETSQEPLSVHSPPATSNVSSRKTENCQTNREVVVDTWRPLTPERDIDANRYDEEYD